MYIFSHNKRVFCLYFFTLKFILRHVQILVINDSDISSLTPNNHSNTDTVLLLSFSKTIYLSTCYYYYNFLLLQFSNCFLL